MQTQATDVVSIRIPAKLKKRLTAIAKTMDRSQNWLIANALEDYVELYDWQVEEIKKSVKKADNGGKFYSSEEVNLWIEQFKV